MWAPNNVCEMFQGQEENIQAEIGLYKAVCDETFEDGRESGGKSDYLWMEKSRRTSWKW